MPDRIDLIQRLLDRESVELNGGSEPVRNIASRYRNYAGVYTVPIWNGRQIAATVRIMFCVEFVFPEEANCAQEGIAWYEHSYFSCRMPNGSGRFADEQ